MTTRDWVALGVGAGLLYWMAKRNPAALSGLDDLAGLGKKGGAQKAAGRMAVPSEAKAIKKELESKAKALDSAVKKLISLAAKNAKACQKSCANKTGKLSAENKAHVTAMMLPYYLAIRVLSGAILNGDVYSENVPWMSVLEANHSAKRLPRFVLDKYERRDMDVDEMVAQVDTSPDASVPTLPMSKFLNFWWNDGTAIKALDSTRKIFNTALKAYIESKERVLSPSKKGHAFTNNEEIIEGYEVWLRRHAGVYIDLLKQKVDGRIAAMTKQCAECAIPQVTPGVTPTPASDVLPVFAYAEGVRHLPEDQSGRPTSTQWCEIKPGGGATMYRCYDMSVPRNDPDPARNFAAHMASLQSNIDGLGGQIIWVDIPPTYGV